MSKDEQQINLLSIFHYVIGIVSAILNPLAFVYLAIGFVMLSSVPPMQPLSQAVVNHVVGWGFIVWGVYSFILGWVYSIIMFIIGRQLKQRRAYKFCMVMASVYQANFPFATVLGIFTNVVLSRPSVIALFQKDTMSTKAVLSELS